MVEQDSGQSLPGSIDVPPVELPRGRYPARLDDKGRLKLPAQFHQFFGSLSEKKLFVTSLDRRTAQIYPISVWRENEKFFDSYRGNPKAVRNRLFTAHDLGSEAEPDAQGRITFNPELRRELDLENTPLHLYAERGHVLVLTEALYQERRRAAEVSVEDEIEDLERAGLK